MSVREPGRITVGVVFLGAGAGWTGGNIGRAVTQISHAFDVSLSTVGLLMTVFFAAIAVVTVFAPPLGTAAFVLLGIFVALAGLTNVRPAAPQANSTPTRQESGLRIMLREPRSDAEVVQGLYVSLPLVGATPRHT
jgi:hypothetical protein